MLYHHLAGTPNEHWFFLPTSEINIGNKEPLKKKRDPKVITITEEDPCCAFIPNPEAKYTPKARSVSAKGKEIYQWKSINNEDREFIISEDDSDESEGFIGLKIASRKFLKEASLVEWKIRNYQQGIGGSDNRLPVSEDEYKRYTSGITAEEILNQRAIQALLEQDAREEEEAERARLKNLREQQKKRGAKRKKSVAKSKASPLKRRTRSSAAEEKPADEKEKAEDPHKSKEPVAEASKEAEAPETGSEQQQSIPGSELFVQEDKEIHMPKSLSGKAPKRDMPASFVGTQKDFNKINEAYWNLVTRRMKAGRIAHAYVTNCRTKKTWYDLTVVRANGDTDVYPEANWELHRFGFTEYVEIFRALLSEKQTEVRDRFLDYLKTKIDNKDEMERQLGVTISEFATPAEVINYCMVTRDINAMTRGLAASREHIILPSVIENMNQEIPAGVKFRSGKVIREPEHGIMFNVGGKKYFQRFSDLLKCPVQHLVALRNLHSHYRQPDDQAMKELNDAIHFKNSQHWEIKRPRMSRR